MDEAVFKTLEFYKVRGLLAEEASSSLGRELAETLLPSCDRQEIERRLEETSEARSLLEASMNIPLGGIHDVRELAHRAELGSILEPTDLLSIGSTLYAGHRMKKFFSNLEEHLPQLTFTVDGIVELRRLEDDIDKAVSEKGQLRDDASVELYRLRRDIRTAQNRIKDKLGNILHSAEYQKYFQDNLVTMRGDRYVIPVKQEYRRYFPGIVHDQSSSGATVFIEPMAVVNLNNDIKSLAAEEKNEVERILRRLTANVAVSAAEIMANCAVLGQVDFAVAKARLSLSMRAAKPQLNDKGYIELHQARHPLIAKDIVVPIDVWLGAGFNTLLITGPNTGGKTVTLKTVGLFALMVQSGLFILADNGSQMTVFSNIYADIGDEQSIEQSLSTFSAHMTNLVRILSRVSPNDLVLIDEIGAGTDPVEGSALAMAVLDHLHQLGTRTIITTHYSELKTFAYTRAGMENASVEFDMASLRPTYRLLIGIPGSSNAFAISQRLGLSQTIIAQAQAFIAADHADFETTLASLEEEKKQYMREKDEMAAAQQDVAALRLRLRDKEAALAERRQAALSKAREDAAQIVRNARREAEEIIASLKEQFSEQDKHKRQEAIVAARKKIRGKLGALSAFTDIVPGESLRPEQVTVGMAVYVASLKQKGTVVSFDDSEVCVQMGIMKATLPLRELRSTAQQTAEHATASKRKIDFAKVVAVPRQVDIRGMTVDEAVPILDKYIDDALLAGLDEVLVIHGKGTGALRKGVREYLKNHCSVKSAAIAALNEGGDGATSVKFK